MNAYERYAKLLAEVETLEEQVADMKHIYNVKFESMHIQDTCNKIISITNED